MGLDSAADPRCSSGMEGKLPAASLMPSLVCSTALNTIQTLWKVGRMIKLGHGGAKQGQAAKSLAHGFSKARSCSLSDTRGLCVFCCRVAEVKELVDPEKGAILVCSRGGQLRNPEDDPEDDPNALTGTSKTQTRYDVRSRGSSSRPSPAICTMAGSRVPIMEAPVLLRLAHLFTPPPPPPPPPCPSPSHPCFGVMICTGL